MLPGEGTCGVVVIPEGEYWVAPQLESATINLVGAGKDYSLKAVRRRKKTNSRSTNIVFSCGGGSTWSLVVSSPKFGEWAAFIEVKKSKAREKGR